MARENITLSAGFDIETVFTALVAASTFLSRKKAKERVLLIICLNHLLKFIISRKFSNLI